MTRKVYQNYVTRRAQGSLGVSRQIGLHDKLYKQLYRSFGIANKETDEFIYNKHYPLRSGKEYLKLGPSGGIFNLEFNPDGSILGAACEQKSIILFDPQTRRPFKFIEKAHDDCVNCIRFFDSRLFATCSDDTTVALWDARFLKHRLRTLRGHSNWVKNIEFSHKDNCLVTSGFDGAIYTWDINNYSERTNGDPEFRKVFYTNGLMRMRLTPTWDKMVVSTMNGYLMVVHDLCLDTMSKDLQNFKPNMYRLMQISGKPLPVAVQYTPLFHAKRNRVEFICDFPEDDEAEIISSLQLHPQGWVAVSRNVSSDDSSEWCCVHDIQSYPSKEEMDEDIDPELKVFKSIEEKRKRRRVSSERNDNTSAQRNAGLGMARLAEFIGGVNFESRRSQQRESQQGERRTSDNAREQTIEPSLSDNLHNLASRVPVISIIQANDRSITQRSNDDVENISQNLDDLPEYRIRTLVDGVEQRSSSSNLESSSNDQQRSLNDDEENEGNRPTNTSNLVDIIQLLRSVTRPETQASRSRTSNQQSGSQNAGPSSQQEDSRVPSSHENSDNPHRSSMRIPISSHSDHVNQHNEENDAQSNNHHRSQFGQQGFIIFPPDPRNNGQPSILYFGGSGEGERGVSSERSPDTTGYVVPPPIVADSSRNDMAARSGNEQHSRNNLSKHARLHHNSMKLTNYLQESNQGRGFIKEVSFSSDGRIIASPFAYGIRLLAFNADCSDLSNNSPTTLGPSSARQLNEILHITGCHEDVVLSSTFSPHDLTLVTGCLSGKVVWNQPVL